jgi:hypothetical protein
VLFGLAWLMWQTAGQFGQTGETTAQLKLPKSPFIYGMAVLCGITGAVHLAMLGAGPVEKTEGEGVAL